MTLFLVFIAVLAAGGIALAETGLPWRRAANPSSANPSPAGRPAAVGGPGLAEPDPRLPPVLLPEHVQPADIGRLRFSVAFRGYRMDQVDAVLAQLGTALAQRDAALAAGQQTSGDSPRDPEARP